MRLFVVAVLCGIMLASCAIGSKSVVVEESFSNVKEVEMTREEFEELFGEKEEIATKEDVESLEVIEPIALSEGI